MSSSSLRRSNSVSALWSEGSAVAPAVAAVLAAVGHVGQLPAVTAGCCWQS